MIRVATSKLQSSSMLLLLLFSCFAMAITADKPARVATTNPTASPKPKVSTGTSHQTFKWHTASDGGKGQANSDAASSSSTAKDESAKEGSTAESTDTDDDDNGDDDEMDKDDDKAASPAPASSSSSRKTPQPSPTSRGSSVTAPTSPGSSATAPTPSPSRFSNQANSTPSNDDPPKTTISSQGLANVPSSPTGRTAFFLVPILAVGALAFFLNAGRRAPLNSDPLLETAMLQESVFVAPKVSTMAAKLMDVEMLETPPRYGRSDTIIQVPAVDDRSVDYIQWAAV